MRIIQKIILYILYFFKVSKVKVTEPIYTLPLDYNTALKSIIKSGKDISYKIYPSKWYLIYWKIKITKININFWTLNYKYLYSWWLSDKRFLEREFLKFSEEDYDFMIDLLKATLFKQENVKILKEYSYESNRYITRYDSLERILFETKNEYIQEYILDQIFKLFPDKLYELIDIIYTNRFSDYIKTYYGKLLILLFEFTDYTKLIKYFDIFESVYTWDSKSDKIRKKLLEIIQKKNILEIKKEQLKKKI